nr:class I SAM-dependent methyltransferase [Pseudomonas sp. PDM26]
MPSVFSDGKGNGNPGFVHTFSRIAPTYEEKYGTKLSQAHDECLRILSRWLCTSSPEGVLDIGCGTGALIERMFAQWPDARFEGVDPAQGMVDEGVKRRPFASFVKGVAEALPFPSQSMDLVVCSMSFGHWADKSAGLNEVRRVLKPQGLFCLVENQPAGWGLTSLINWLLGSLADYRSEHEVIQLAQTAGLQSMETRVTDQHVIVATFRPCCGEVGDHGR